MSALAGLIRWNEAPLGALVDHIVTTYHRPMPAALRDLQALARRAFGAALDDRLGELRDLLAEHMRREEQLVFPWLRRVHQDGAAVLVSLLEREHDDAERRIRDLIALAEAGGGAPRSATALAARLRALAADHSEHVRLEDGVLFPRALVACASR